MKSDEKISELLVKTGAYKDLDEPVILTSGELGIYYINTEKLVQDGGEFKEYGEDSETMINHAVRMMEEHPSFGEVINILTEKARKLIGNYEPTIISGGQRRDWLFSGPVAYQLGLPHMSIYKDEKIEILGPGGGPFEPFNFDAALDLHIVDLLTEGSSCYRIEIEEKGRIPTVRETGGDIRNLMAVVTRLQGGEERLLEQDVNVESCIAIDEDFLKTHSSNPERALAYNENPKAWSEEYLRENGALALIETFNPQAGKLKRAKAFLRRYEDVLLKADKWGELEREVNKRYNTTLGKIRCHLS